MNLGDFQPTWAGRYGSPHGYVLHILWRFPNGHGIVVRQILPGDPLFMAEVYWNKHTDKDAFYIFNSPSDLTLVDNRRRLVEMLEQVSHESG